jgi:hypothetical protein
MGLVTKFAIVNMAKMGLSSSPTEVMRASNEAKMEAHHAEEYQRALDIGRRHDDERKKREALKDKGKRVRPPPHLYLHYARLEVSLVYM